MSQAKITLRAKITHDENSPPATLQRNTSSNKLSQLLQSHNTVRSGLSPRTTVKPRRPLGQKSVNTQSTKHNRKLKEITNLKESTNSIENVKTAEMKSTLDSSNITKRSPKEPTISFALPVSKSRSVDSDIFANIDTPVHTLPTDCLITIFEYCKDFETFCSLLGVCRRWRYIAAQPFLWKHTHIQWLTLSKQISLLHRPRMNFDQLNYIKKLTIRHHNRTVIRNPLIDIVKITPFKMLKELYLIDMDLTDIAFLISWLKDIKVLHCRNIHVSRGRINLSIFSDLDQLESLHLHCAERYPFGQASFTPFRNTVYQKKLPTSLKSLSIWNVYDCEELLDDSASSSSPDYEENISSQPPSTQEQLLNDWTQFDNQLVSKYLILTSLHNLKSLALGRVSSFTSRVWRECLTPCAENLEYLSMNMWEGAKKRESPERLLLLHRQRSSSQRPDSQEAEVYDVDVALSDFISSLKNVKKIRLHEFVCEDGLIEGITKLGRQYILTCDNNLKYNDIRDLRNTILCKTIIQFQ